MKKLCVGCNKIKEVFQTETEAYLELCAECLEAIWNDQSLKDDVEMEQEEKP